MANRCGSEEEATYTGTSCVLGIQAGEVKVYGILGRSEKELLVVDTSKQPQAKLVAMPNSAVANTLEESTAESTFSRNSDASGSTVDTACTSPTIDDVPMTMADLMTPISPADPNFPNAYFQKGNHAEPDSKYETLKSSVAEPCYPSGPERPDSRSDNLEQPDDGIREKDHKEQITQPQEVKEVAKMQRVEKIQEVEKLEPKAEMVEKEQCFSPSLPESPTIQRDSQPKLRKASHTRQAYERETVREALKLSISPPVSTPPLPDSPTFNRPTSQKSHSPSRTRQVDKQEPALISHDLAKEEQDTQRAVAVKSPVLVLPETPAVAPERCQSSFTAHTFGSRNQYIIPRPKSAVW